MNRLNLNGIAVTERRGDTIFIRLPRALWRFIEGGCSCPTCAETGRAAFWDTLAVTAGTPPPERADCTWTCHHPEELSYEPIDVVELDMDGTAVISRSRTRPPGPGYWSLLIPWSPTPTEWHPTERTGPLATLCRGCFKTETEALIWARDKLCGESFSVRFYVSYPEEGAS